VTIQLVLKKHSYQQFRLLVLEKQLNYARVLTTS
ncbi:hypothetical protein ABIB40_004255, partial [Pedobacter sp. UYP30]